MGHATPASVVYALENVPVIGVPNIGAAFAGRQDCASQQPSSFRLSDGDITYQIDPVAPMGLAPLEQKPANIRHSARPRGAVEVAHLQHAWDAQADDTANTERQSAQDGRHVCGERQSPR